MYIPGMKELVLFFLAVLLVMVALVTQSPLAPALALSVLAAYYVYTKKYAILELVYRDRVLLLHPVGLSIKRIDGRGDHVEVREKRRTWYMAFLRVRDTDPPAPSLGKAAERAIASLYHQACETGVVSVLREGGYEYYVYIKARDRRILRAAIADIHRQLLANGVYLEPEDPAEVLGAILRQGREFKPTVPLFTTAIVALFAASALLGTPLPAVLALPLFVLALYEPRMLKGKTEFAVEPTLSLRSSIAASEAQAETMASSARTMALTAQSGYIIASLKPVDTALLEAKARHAMEVIESARGGVSKVMHEFDAMRTISMWRALQSGAAPFIAVASATPEIARALQTSGLAIGSASRLNTLCSLGLIPPGTARSLYVSHQLTFMAPQAYKRPRTGKTPKAIYLGHGLRRDEEVWLEIDKLENVHGYLVGPYGSGKSTTARTIALRALERGLVPLVVDPSGEYRRFANLVGWEVIDLWDRQLDISRMRASDLATAFDYIAPLSDAEFFELKRALEDGDLFSARLAKLEYIRDYFSKPSITVEELLSAEKPFLLCLGSTKEGRYAPVPADIMRFSLSVLLVQMKEYVLNRGLSEPRFLLIVDEAHLFAKPPRFERETELTTMARMLRKFGLAILLVAHDFKDIDDTFLRHAGWRIAMSHSDPQYVSDAAHYFEMQPAEVTWFRRGIRGRAVLRRGFEPWNVLLEVQPEEVAKTEYGKAG
jgi:hypothetical protein